MQTALQQVRRQVGGLAKHAAGAVVQEPFEVLKSAAGKRSDANESQEQAADPLEQASGQQGALQDDTFSGFETKADFDRYAALAAKRDDILLRQQRRRLREMFGVPLDVEGGMQRARAERQESDEQRGSVDEEAKKEEKQALKQQAKAEDLQVASAKAGTGAETGPAKKIVG